MTDVTGWDRAAYGDEWIVADALADFRRREGLPADGGASARTVSYPVGPWSLTIPNFAARRRALELHDLQHLATGYATDWAGESRIAAWELGSGCGRYMAPWFLATAAFTAGAFLHPRAVWSAFVRGRASQSLFRMPNVEAVQRGTLGALRHAMRIPQEQTPGRVVDVLWFAVALVPAIVLVMVVGAGMAHLLG